MVDEKLLEVVGSISPILLQVLRKIARDDHAATVSHVTRGFQLSHKCINEWHTGLTFPPPLDRLLVSLPSEVLAFVYTVFVQNPVAILHTPECIILFHSELIDEGGNLRVVN